MNPASMHRCPVCTAHTTIRPTRDLFAFGDGFTLACSRFPACDTYVGCHNGTKVPKGTPANAELRRARIQAHAAFDPWWMRGRVSRTAAYLKLSEVLSIPAEKCHIGMLDLEQCASVVRLFKLDSDVQAVREAALAVFA